MATRRFDSLGAVTRRSQGRGSTAAPESQDQASLQHIVWFLYSRYVDFQIVGVLYIARIMNLASGT